MQPQQACKVWSGLACSVWHHCAVHQLLTCLCRYVTYHRDYSQTWNTNYGLWTNWYDFDVFVWIYYYIHSFTHLFIRSPIHPFIQPLIHPMNHLYANPSYCTPHQFIHWSIFSYVPCLCSYISLLVSPHSHWLIFYLYFFFLQNLGKTERTLNSFYVTSTNESRSILSTK